MREVKNKATTPNIKELIESNKLILFLESLAVIKSTITFPFLKWHNGKNDPIATAQIEELIDELKKEHTIIIVTHSMAQAARVSQNTGFFHLGQLIEHGSTDKIFKNPDDKKTQDYITGRFG